MLEAIAQCITALVSAGAFGLFAPRVHHHLLIKKSLMQHDEVRQLTTLTIGTVITELYNGQDCGDLTLDAQIINVELRLADVLLANGYHPVNFNPHHLVTAVLVQSQLLKPLLEAIKDREERAQCVPSTGSLPATPPRQSAQGAN